MCLQFELQVAIDNPKYSIGSRVIAVYSHLIGWNQTKIVGG